MDVNSVFSRDGLLSKKTESFDYRPQQLQLAQLIERGLKEGKNVIAEGATGVGKSFAYLVPIILEGQKVIVSTSNKSLQDQLAQKDLPFLKEVLAPHLTWVALKGKSNYFCRKNYKNNYNDVEKLLDLEQLEQLKKWIEETEDGDLEFYPYELPYRVKEMICCNENTKHDRKKNDFYTQNCFAIKARDRAKDANIVLVNHTLLGIDIYLKLLQEKEQGGILPNTSWVVIDEAHKFEDMASRAFTDKINIFSVNQILSRYLVQNSVNSTLIENILKNFKKAIKKYQPAKNGYYYEQKVFETLEGFDLVQQGLSQVADELSTSKEYKEGSEEYRDTIQQHIQEINNLKSRLKMLEEEDENSLRWVDAYETKMNSPKFGKVITSLNTAPITVAPMMKSGLIDKKNIIAVSATLATNGSFDYFRTQLPIEKENSLEMILGSPFNFRENTILYISDGSLDVEHEMKELLLASKGRAFVLFTSYKDMNHYYKYLEIPYKKLIQDKNISRSQLIEEFKETPNAVLFATKSFWEGVDIKGTELSMVIIHKIPFGNPADLMYKTKTKMYEQTYGRGAGWTMYGIPDACLQLKQGAGRLIRSKTDKGAVALLDSRVGVKPYGKQVIASFPPEMPRTQQLDKIRNFFIRIE